MRVNEGGLTFGNISKTLMSVLIGYQTWGLRPTSGKYVLMIDLSSRDPLEKIESQGPSPKCHHFLQISNSIPIINPIGMKKVKKLLADITMKITYLIRHIKTNKKVSCNLSQICD